MIDSTQKLNCRCCGKPVNNFERIIRWDGYPIHTRCIPKHWGKHQRDVNNTRCREFGTGKAGK